MNIDVTKYLSIPYLHEGRDMNGLDCYGLVIMFYADNFGITLPDYAYCQNWDTEGLNYIQEEYWKRFEKIDAPVKHGVVTFRMFGSPIERHIGIMLDDISFLHVALNDRVCVEKITHRVWSRQIGSFYKLKEDYVHTINHTQVAD